MSVKLVPIATGSNTSSVHPALVHLRSQVVTLLLQGFDFSLLVQEEVGDHGLASNQDAGQQCHTGHLVGTIGATSEKR